MDTIYKVLDREMKKFVPTKIRRANEKPIWMNKNILRLIRKKKRGGILEMGVMTMLALRHIETSKKKLKGK